MIVSEDITVNPFEVNVHVVIGETLEEGLKYWSENIEPKHDLDINSYKDSNGLMLRIVNEGIHHYGVILFLNSPYSTILHELFHLMMNVANDKGASWSEESDEWYAYCLSDLWEQVDVLYDKYKKL
jgi:hypothetical protein